MTPVPLHLLIVPTAVLALTACAEVKDTLTRADARLHEVFSPAPNAGGSDRDAAGRDRGSADSAARAPTDDTLQAARLMDGDGVARDPEAAVALLRPHAENGFPDAQFLLGLAYRSGQGVARDRAAALSWFRRAADQGQAQAQYLLGLAYLNGDGVARDADQAAAWFGRSAQHGNSGAQYHLGLGYAGNDQPRDALRWLETAANQGHAEAQYMTGEFYHLGRGTARDPAWATRWFGKAAAQGVARAQYMLGLAYAAPSGVPRQIETAYYWLAIAERNGDARAADYRDRIGALLPKATRTAVAARAERWQPSSDQGATTDDRPSLVFVQLKLAEAGFEPGPADGLSGPKTRAAILRYRAARSIGAGTQIDQTLLDALKAEGATAVPATAPS